MGINKVLCILSFALTIHCALAESQHENDSIIMRLEADAFRCGMPTGLQKKQALAVETAINGDTTLLNEVRNSRNSSPTYSGNVIVTDMKIAGQNGHDIPARLYSPIREGGTLPLLVYFHGGGWTFGSLNSCARYCDAIASTGIAKVLAVDYVLAPEHPYPEGLHDCIDAVEYAFANSKELGVDPSSISVGGDSSGGNLALATALHNVDNTKLPIKSLVLYYPVVIAENDGSESWLKYGDGFGLDADLMDKFNEAYISSVQPANIGTISPAFATDNQLLQLPPMLMINAERDILSSQGESFSRRLTELGCSVKHITFPGAVHLFITVAGQNRAFSRSIDLSTSFLNDPKRAIENTF